MSEATRFLNVDLDVCGPLDVGPLIEALEVQGAFCLHNNEHEGEWSACFELSGPSDSAESTLLGLVGMVERLPPAAREIWNRARVRDFNIGIQAGAEPYSFCAFVGPEALSLVADLGGRLGVTVYAAVKEEAG